MNDEIKEILIKDFNEILVKEFRTDWKEKRLYIELLVNSTPFSNLLDYITNLQQEKDDYKSRNEKAIEYVKSNVIQIKLNEVGTVTTVSEKFDKDEFLDILQGVDK